MKLPDNSHDTPPDLSVNEQRSLRMRLQQKGIPEKEVEEILEKLNPLDAPVIIIAKEEREKYECVSWCGIDNSRIHIPVRSGLQNRSLVFDWTTGLYYIRRPSGVDVLE